MPCNSRQTGRQADRADGRRQQTADTERHREKHRAPATQVPWPVGWLACVSGLAGLGEGCECALGPRRLHVRQVPPPCRALPCLALAMSRERERYARSSCWICYVCTYAMPRCLSHACARGAQALQHDNCLHAAAVSATALAALPARARGRCWTPCACYAV